LHEAREAFLHVLDGYTLADLTTPAPDLLTLLGIALSTGGVKRAASKPAPDTIPAVRPGRAECALPGGRIVYRPSNRS